VKILVLGGTGHLGAAIVREALARGHAVSLASRREQLPASLDGSTIARLRLDIEDRAALRRAAEGHGLVIDAAAPYPLYPETGAVERAVARMRSVIRAVASVGARFAYVSSFVTLPGQRGIGARTVRGLHPYFAVKQAMEDELLRACAAGLRAVIVNPTACLGPWDSKPRELAIVPLLLAQKLPAMVTATINVVDVREVARALLEAVERERFGQPIALSGHNLPADQLAARICALAEVPPPAARVPLWPTVVGALWLDGVHAVLGRESPYPALSVLLIGACESFEVSEVQRQLGAAPRPLDDTLRDAIAWHRRP
jgi:dihydroflavonol-4-reductase